MTFQFVFYDYHSKVMKHNLLFWCRKCYYEHDVKKYLHIKSEENTCLLAIFILFCASEKFLCASINKFSFCVVLFWGNKHSEKSSQNNEKITEELVSSFTTLWMRMRCSLLSNDKNAELIAIFDINFFDKCIYIDMSFSGKYNPFTIASFLIYGENLLCFFHFESWMCFW